MGELTKRVLFDREAIAGRVREMAKEISAKYPEGDILFIGVLKGSFVFLADLVRALDVPCQVDFCRIASYGSGTVSSGQLDMIMDAAIPVKDRTVIIVDDIVDSGLTLSEYRKHIAAQSPRSLEIAGLIDKTGRREKHVKLDYCGFRMEEGFVVGYGLDCDERYRHLDSVWVIEEG
jgi:hypoxanthine phosphoribosyltransferase